jgi:hypothetical protein
LANKALNTETQYVSLIPFVKKTVTLPIQWPSGKIDERIKMETDKWNLDIEIKGLGYDLSKVDFENKKIKKLQPKFFLYKDGDEYQVEVFKYGSNYAPAIIPISSQMIDIELTEGAYEITLVGPNWRLKKDIIIE